MNSTGSLWDEPVVILPAIPAGRPAGALRGRAGGASMMPYQMSGGLASETGANDGGEAVGATLRDLRTALAPGKDQPDLGRARAIVDYLIELTGSDERDVRADPAILQLVGRNATILKVLLREAGLVCTTLDLARIVGVHAHSTRVIKVYICQIRAELARHGFDDAIESVWGVGYRIRARDASRVRNIAPAAIRMRPIESLRTRM